MPSNFESAPSTGDAPSGVNDAWYLHSDGRRFGPLSEDEMRGYFLAGMVKTGDLIAIPAQTGTSPAEAVAKVLHVPPPVTATAVSKPVAPMPPASIPSGEASHVNGWLASALALVTIFGLAYFGFSGRLSPSRESKHSIVVQAPQPVADESAPPRVEQELPTPIASAMVSSESLLGARPAPDSTAPAAQPVVTPVAASALVLMEAAPKQVVDVWCTEASRLVSDANWSALVVHSQKWAAAERFRDLPWWYLGVGHAQLRNHPDAIDAFKHALSITPGHFEVRGALADVYMQTRQWQDSASILYGMVEDQPNDAGVWHNIGVVMGQLGEYDQSIQALEKAAKLRPEYRQTWAALGQNYAHFGNMDRSKAAFARANAGR